MADNKERILASLTEAYPNLKDIICTLERCSYDDANNRFLVHNQTKVINFDKLTRWLAPRQGVKSADAMTMTDKFVYFIEFKSGNQTEPESKKDRLIKGVSGKIDDSANTLMTQIFPKTDIAADEQGKVRFFLVVEPQYADAVEMLAAAQLGLSTSATQEKYKAVVLPSLLSLVSNPEYYDKIDVWYSTLFDSYIKKYHIEDIILPKNR